MPGRPSASRSKSGRRKRAAGRTHVIAAYIADPGARWLECTVERKDAVDPATHARIYGPDTWSRCVAVLAAYRKNRDRTPVSVKTAS